MKNKNQFPALRFRIVFVILFFFTLSSFKHKDLTNITKDQILNGQEYYFELEYCKELPLVNRKPYCNMNGIDSLVKVMNLDYSYNNEIQIHSPSLGSESRNLKSTQNKANTLKEYMIKFGISPERIKATGLGNTKPYVVESDTIIQSIPLLKGDVIDKKYINTLYTKKYNTKSINEVSLLSNRNVVKIIKK